VYGLLMVAEFSCVSYGMAGPTQSLFAAAAQGRTGPYGHLCRDFMKCRAEVTDRRAVSCPDGARPYAVVA
jgi:hypothetical protein